MYSRWMNVAVIVLWLTSMSWLVVKKVLPPLLVGQPPSYRTIVQAQRNEPPVGWEIDLNGRTIGWAVNKAERLPNQVTEIHSRIHIDQLPLNKLVSGNLRFLLNAVDWPNIAIGMETQNIVTIDPLGRLSHFQSAVKLVPLGMVLKLKGMVDGDRLRLTAYSENFSYPTELPLPPEGTLGDAVAPQTQLPGLRRGQAWTVPVYNPLRPQQPLEILQAKVEDSTSLSWNGRTHSVWRVVYRRDSGAGLGSSDTPCGRLWVRRDGTVLKQETTLLGSTLTFVRLPNDASLELQQTAEQLKIDFQIGPEVKKMPWD